MCRHRGPKPLAGLVVLTILITGCRARDEAAVVRLVACAEATERGLTAAPAARMAAIAATTEEREACAAEVFAGCGVEPAATEQSGVPLVALACLRAYCGRFDPAPRLCEEPELLARPDVASARREAEAFIAAKLALDLGLARDDPRLTIVARPFARLWAVEAMHAELDEPPPLR